MKKSNWVVYKTKEDFDEIGEKYGIDPVIARIIINRGISSEKINMYLNGTLEDMHDPYLMKDAKKAAEILIKKIKEHAKIRIIGDYDIDGVCSTAILYKGLKKAGAVVDYDIPDRIADGYGVNKNLIDKAINDGIDTIVTCDNGISAIDEINYAKEKKMTVVVTDHHEVPYETESDVKIYKYSNADAIVDPKQEACKYPFDLLCGAGVAYKVIQIIYDMSGFLSGINKSKYMSDIEEYAELMAVATVGDVVDLTDENRIIVKYGLKHIANTKNTGLKALVNACELDICNLSAYHIGFIIGPCLNASGRLDTAKKAVSLLLEEDEKKAIELANELKELNDERKDLTQNEADKAIDMIENTGLSSDKVLVVYLPECHESIAGIIAGRIRERFYKPVFVVTDSSDEAKGSGRSIEGYNMFEEITKCSNLLTKFGGHPMAAGFSLPKENIDAFRKMLNTNQTLTDEQLTPVTNVDAIVPADYVSIKLVEQLNCIEPFGKGNEKPVFGDVKLTVRSAKIIGKNQNVLKMQLQTQKGGLIDAVKFGVDDEPVPERGRMIHIVYYPDINEYNGRRTLQLKILEWCY